MVTNNANGGIASFWKSRWLTLLLLVADTAGLSLAWQGAYRLREAMNPWLGPINDIAPYLKVHPLIVIVGLLNCMAFGLYVHRRRLMSLNRLITIIKAGYHWLLYIVVVGFFFKELDLGRSVIIFCGCLGFLYLYCSRTVFRWMKRQALQAGRGTVRVAIVGSGTLAIETKDFLSSHPEIGYSLAGLIAHNDEESREVSDEELREHDVKILGDLNSLEQIISRHNIEELFLAIAHLEEEEQFDLLHRLEAPGVRVHVVSNVFGVITDQAKVDEIGAHPVITLKAGRVPWHQEVMKRTLDIFCSAIGIAVWMLFFHWWIAWKIRRESPGPVFFTQERVGRSGKRFQLIKYRTMRRETAPYAVAPMDEADPRITGFGRWLRKTSLDELPQLINVFKGDMSMVGPRPEMPFIVEKYEPWQRRRLDVKPGLTGLWQVIGRKNLPLHLNMQYDLYYIKNQSFLLDIEILLRTVPAVWKGKGAF